MKNRLLTPALVKELEKCNHEYRLLSTTKKGYLQDSESFANFYCIRCLDIVSRKYE